MAIDRINKIKNHRVFRGFVWPHDLLDFKEKNLFYGWNGSGKSTLSNLFRSIEKRTAISEGEVEFVISDRSFSHDLGYLAMSPKQAAPTSVLKRGWGDAVGFEIARDHAPVPALREKKAREGAKGCEVSLRWRL